MFKGTIGTSTIFLKNKKRNNRFNKYRSLKNKQKNSWSYSRHLKLVKMCKKIKGNIIF